MAGENGDKPSGTVISIDDGFRRIQPSPRDQVEYIADLLDELTTIALKARASELATVLASAKREATRFATGRSAGA